MKYQETIWYEDELNDDFGTSVKHIRPLPKKYKYITTNFILKFFDFIIYRLIVRPFAWFYMKIKFGHKIKNKKILKNIKSGYFIYANHTTIIGDAFMPNLLSIKTKNYIITGEQANSLTKLLPILRGIGALPLTSQVKDNIKLMKAIKIRIEQKASITIYPEAHVWPYYTDIRPFPSESFKYASKRNTPIIAMTNCYKKRKLLKRPKIITYLDGPFYPKDELNSKENANYLRDIVYQKMKERTKEHSTYSYFNYKKKETN